MGRDYIEQSVNLVDLLEILKLKFLLELNIMKLAIKNNFNKTIDFINNFKKREEE